MMIHCKIKELELIMCNEIGIKSELGSWALCKKHAR